jgi:flagellar hook protein FlgE
MSLYGAMFSGVSGLFAQSQSLAMISDNISNVNTVGYKGATEQFSTLVTGANTSGGGVYSAGGVRSSTFQTINKQGLIQTSSSGTDVAIAGAGFFAVNSRNDGLGDRLYTRAGSFIEDEQGYLVNAAGLFLMGWPVDPTTGTIPAASSDISTLQPVNARQSNGVAVATTTVTVSANLQSTQTGIAPPAANLVAVAVETAGNQPEEPNFTRAVRVFDALGTPHDINISFLKTNNAANNEWFTVIHAVPSTDVTAGGGVLASGLITFNGDGTPAAIDPALTSPLAITWTNPAAPSSITFNLGTAGAVGTARSDGLTQFAAAYGVNYILQNGAEVGERNGLAIDKDGYVVASYTNGASQRLYRVPVATFANPTRLESRNGNAYSQTDDSGAYNLRLAGTSGAGRIEPSALEASNVDLADEFTKMIVTQRAYSASAKMVTTADEMLEELLRIKR